MPTVVFGFTSLMLTQLVTYQVDLKLIERGMAPKWFLRFRSLSFSLYMAVTSLLFCIFYARIDQVQKRNHNERIS